MGPTETKQNPQPLRPSDVIDNPAITAETLTDIVETYPNTVWRPFPWLETLVAVLAAVTIAIAARRIYRRYKRRKTVPRAKTPQDLFDDALSALESADATDAASFYSRVRPVLNAYFQLRWGKAVESLSPEELLVGLDIEATEGDKGVPLKQTIKRYMGCVFGGETPAAEARREDLELLRALVPASPS